jgi:hypothetical protein
MAASLDDALSLLSRWKKDGNRLRIRLSQTGHASLEADVIIDDRSNEKEIVFSFGFPKLAEGTVVVPLSKLVVFTILHPDDPHPLEPISPDFDSCLQITWIVGQDRCVVCAIRKPLA